MNICSKLSDSSIYNIINSSQSIVLASIDIGKTNFCIKIEQRYNQNGYIYINEIVHDLIRLGTNSEESILEYFSGIWEYIMMINIVIIEGQHHRNTTMMVFEKFIESYFVFYIYNMSTNLKCVKCVAASSKYSRLNIIIKGLSKYTIKNHLTPNIATTILYHYGQSQSLHKLNTSTKKDDFSDTILLIESFLRHYDRYKLFHNVIDIRV